MSNPDDADRPTVAHERAPGAQGAPREPLSSRLRGSWSAAARPYRLFSATVESLFSAAFVVGIYELVVAGGTTLWPTATDDWILPMWIAAATLSGLGLKPVRTFARGLVARLWPAGATDPYAALAAFAANTSAAEPAERALRQLARVAVAGTGAASATVWLVTRDGDPRPAGQWPDDADPVRPGSGYDVPIVSDGEQLGILVLNPAERRGLTARDMKLAQEVANSAGLLARAARLTARLADQVRLQARQAADLDRSRRRLLAARDAAREQVGTRIGARVGDPLLQCSTMISALLDDGAASAGAPGEQLAEMIALIDTAIRDFRAIVHGVYPAALTDHGLAAALENLLADLPRRATFTHHDLPRLEPRIEAGAYFCIAALVGTLPDRAADGSLDLRVEIVDDRLAVTLVDAEPSAADPHSPDTRTDIVQRLLNDRIEALEGEIRLSRTPGGMRYELEVPTHTPEAVRA